LERETVTELVEKNDDASRRALFEEYYRRTYAVAFNILRSRESAEDITQDAFIKAFENMHQLREQDKFGAWLAVIASNLARNHLKREKRLFFTDDLTQFEQGGQAAATEDDALRELEIEQIRATIRRLPPEHYQVVVLQYYYDLKVEDIARMLKISTGTVKSRLFRARQKLSRLLELNAAAGCLSCEGGGEEL
jgi:RNA polymerase sigma-70 factor, ECF subfamily